VDIFQTPQAIAQRVADLGQAITTFYQDVDPAFSKTDSKPKTLLVLGLLNGSFMFMADLIRQLDLPCEVRFIKVSSYGDGRQSNGQPLVDWLGLQPTQWAGRHVLVVDDILDTGLSVQTVVDALLADPQLNPASCQVAVLLDKPAGRDVPLAPQYTPQFVGFTLSGEDATRYVVGYGLDDAGAYRELPYLGLL
jgi:hypoxanthine phosphoribosyltransferase